MARRFSCPDELESLVEKLLKLSIESPNDAVRENSRQTLLKYLDNYATGRRPQRFVEFYCAQLEYEYESGRDSALTVLCSLIGTLKHVSYLLHLLFLASAIRRVT